MAGDEEKNEKELKFEMDENWQKEVEKDRERLKREEQKTGGQAQAAAEGGPSAPLPEPDLRTFLSGLYTQTLIALGAVEHPFTKKRETDLNEAQYVIDTIAMLETKMKGNLSEQEEKYFKGVLYDLRMRFVDAKSGGAKKQS